MKYELNRSYNGGGVVYVLKARHLDQHERMWLGSAEDGDVFF